MRNDAEGSAFWYIESNNRPFNREVSMQQFKEDNNIIYQIVLKSNHLKNYVNTTFHYKMNDTLNNIDFIFD